MINQLIDNENKQALLQTSTYFLLNYRKSLLYSPVLFYMINSEELQMSVFF